MIACIQHLQGEDCRGKIARNSRLSFYVLTGVGKKLRNCYVRPSQAWSLELIGLEYDRF
jgi:hypothetical protein